MHPVHVSNIDAPLDKVQTHVKTMTQILRLKVNLEPMILMIVVCTRLPMRMPRRCR